MGTSAYVPTKYTPPPRRGPASSYEEEQERSAQDYYEGQRGEIDRDRGDARSRRTQMQQEADKAYNEFRQPLNNTAVGSWSPEATRGYAPTQVAQWMASASMSPAPSRSPSTSARIASPGGGSPGGFKSSNLEAFDTSALDNFDPSAAASQFYQGAKGDLFRDLGDELEVLQNQSVGAGRFRSNLFDEDQGRVITRLGSTFADRLAQQSGVFSGQRLQALTAGRGFALDRARGIDANSLEAQEFDARLGFDRDKLASDEAINQGQLDLGRYEAETGRFRAGGELAQTADELAYRRAHDLDTLNFDRATRLDEAAAGRARTGLEASLDREGRASSEYDRAADRTSEFASGSRDWAARDREVADLRRELEALKAERAGNPKVGTTAPDPYAANRKVASALGVPFREY